jgi:Pyruvate/2-oxoacid:ferredoxin oxidoreductase delta subunit
MIQADQKLWYKAARTIAKAGQLPMVISDTLIQLLKEIMTDEEAEFVLTFKKPSLSIQEIKEKIELPEYELNALLNSLMDKGVIVGTESRNTSIKVFRLLGPFPGLFEMQFLRGERGEKQKRMARLFDKLFEEMSEGTQKNYDNIVSQFKNFSPIVRVVPVEEEIEQIPVDEIIPYEEVSKIVDKFENIALVHCYCRHEKDLLQEPCKITNERLNCFLLGKSAQFAIEHDFGTSITKKDAKVIISKASDEGLVHKAFHIHLNPEFDEEAICNCCRDCCGIFSLFWKGIMPYHCYTSFLAKVDEDKCIGCRTCEQKCPMAAVEIVDSIAHINNDRCIGCGVCVHHCTEKAMTLHRTGSREVFVPPPKIKKKMLEKSNRS